MRVALRKVEGVESAEVSLERKVAEIRLAPDNRVTLARLRQIIKDNGFNPLEATATVVGHLVARSAGPSLAVRGTDVVLTLAPDPSQPAAHADALSRLKTRPAAAVTIEGTITAERLTVRAIQSLIPDR